MPRFAYRAINVKNYGDSKARRGFWNGTASTAKVQNALLFGRLYDIKPIVQSLKHDGLDPQVVEVFVTSTQANAIPAHQAVVPNFTIPGNTYLNGRTAVIRLS